MSIASVVWNLGLPIQGNPLVEICPSLASLYMAWSIQQPRSDRQFGHLITIYLEIKYQNRRHRPVYTIHVDVTLWSHNVSHLCFFCNILYICTFLVFSSHLSLCLFTFAFIPPSFGVFPHIRTFVCLLVTFVPLVLVSRAKCQHQLFTRAKGHIHLSIVIEKRKKVQT